MYTEKITKVLAVQLPARRVFVQYPAQARTFTSKKSKSLDGNCPTPSQQLRYNPPPNPPATHSMLALRPGNQRLRHPAGSLTQSPQNCPALRRWTFCRWKGAQSAEDSPISIERKKRHMSRLTVGVGHSGMYAVSLDGEWTETELRGEMAGDGEFLVVGICCVVINYVPFSAFRGR